MLPWISHNLRFKKIAKIMLVMFLAIFLFGGAAAVYALPAAGDQTELNFGLKPVQDAIGLASTDIRIIIARIIRAVLGLLGVIAVSLMIWAGYTIMTSGGNEEKVTYGKRIMINAVVGLIIILSSFAIVQYVLNLLSEATGLTGGAGSSKPKIETFAGSGALGKIIKDHYPEKNQIGVKRNTKIVVTFAEPIEPSSIISNDNNTCWGEKGIPVLCDDTYKTPYYGDCITDKKDALGVPVAFDWKADCDHLVTDNVLIYPSVTGAEVKKLTEAAAMTIYEGNDKNAYSFVFKPFEPIGDSLQDVWYTVWLTNDIKKKNDSIKKLEDKVGAFDGQHYSYYAWDFQTDTTFDFDPPFVKSTYPEAEDPKTGAKAKIPRNTIIQINFSEAMDPIMVQGIISDLDVLFTNIISSYYKITGEWKVSNGYTTVEFVSDYPCGQNSCGDTMYCLQINCLLTDLKCTQDLTIMARTASLLTPGNKTFESVPFSGVMDMSGNALDGDKDNTPDGKPIAGKDGNLQLIGDGDQEKVADNYWWNFTVKNEIDRKAPNVNKVVPGLDAGGVSGNAFTQITFSRPMWIYTLDAIQLEEYIDPPIVDVDFWFYRRSETIGVTTTVQLKHREYGANDVDYFYFPSVSSTVKSLNQNCLYPGYGPVVEAIDAGKSPECYITKYDEYGAVSEKDLPVDCVNVNFESATDTGCIQTSDTANLKQPDVVKCIEYQKSISK